MIYNIQSYGIHHTQTLLITNWPPYHLHRSLLLALGMTAVLVNCCFVVVAAVVVFILPTNMSTNGMHSFILNLMRNLPCKGLLSCNIGVMDDANSSATPPITPPRYLIFDRTIFFYVWYGCPARESLRTKVLLV